MHPYFPPKFGGKSASYSPKNTVTDKHWVMKSWAALWGEQALGHCSSHVDVEWCHHLALHQGDGVRVVRRLLRSHPGRGRAVFQVQMRWVRPILATAGRGTR